MHELRNPLVNGNIEVQVRLNNKLTNILSVADIVVAISEYNVLFNFEIIRKPGTMVTHRPIGTILGGYCIANIGKHQLDNIGPISVTCWRKLANVTTTFDIGKI